MKHSALSSLSVLSLFIGTLSLVGCGGSFNVPDSVLSSEGAAPPIVGSVLGGHGPVVGSHVYLLQPSVTAWGGQATSILGNTGATSAGGYPISTNPSGGYPNIPSGWKYVTTDSTGAFNLTGAYSCTAGQPVYIYSYGGNATNTTGTPSNTAIVLLAVLGNCPSSGQTNFGGGSSSPLSYIYVNEVSTVATAYAFQPFTLVTNNTAVDVGTTGGTQGLLGMANAANTAGELYSIQGTAKISTSNYGEGHLANELTATGNGIIPQATIDALANTLAACVDSTGATSTQCSTLFSTARDNGATTGTKPTDIATAAINVARYPAGNSSSGSVDTTYAHDIFTIASGTVPYVPTLSSAPNDWSLVINFPVSNTAYRGATNPNYGLAESVAVDALGQVWVTGQTNESVQRVSPLGAVQPTTQQYESYILGYVSVDGLSNAWTGNADSTSGIYEAGSNGVFNQVYGSGYNSAYVNITDSIGDDYFFASNASTGANYEMFEYPVGSSTSTTPTRYTISPGAITGGTNVAHGAIDASGDFWLTTEVANTGFGGTTVNSQIARVNSSGSSTGSGLFTFKVTQQPEFPAIDHLGNAWIPIQQTAGEIYKVTPTATGAHYTTTILTSGSGNSGAQLTSTFGAAIDGNGNLWVTNRCGNYGGCGSTTGENTIAVINTTGSTLSPGTANKAISPSTNYIPQAQYPGSSAPTALANGPLNVAIDPSGDVWITNYTGGGVFEYVGAAAPVVTPLSSAAGSNQLGVKPQ